MPSGLTQNSDCLHAPCVSIVVTSKMYCFLERGAVIEP